MGDPGVDSGAGWGPLGSQLPGLSSICQALTSVGAIALCERAAPLPSRHTRLALRAAELQASGEGVGGHFSELHVAFHAARGPRARGFR